LTSLLNNSDAKQELYITGHCIEIKKKKEIEIATSNAFECKMVVDDKIYNVWLGGNINPTLRSDLGNELCNKTFENGNLPDFAVCWYYELKKNEWWISLRGKNNISPDLTLIAGKFGGGGHHLASGFTIYNFENFKNVFIF
jgi:nanoRNase/pAp phosphatase (c-di-AMP/oligoRNAs hydrolase)